LIGGILRLVVIDIFAHLDQKDRAYFRETREQRLGAKLETISADRETNVLAFRKTLEPNPHHAAQPYLGGKMPAYADYAVFGCFQWARCISSFPLLLEDDPISTWRRGARLVIGDRLLSAFDGFAGKALGYPV
jgi:glutathione S-transferase